MVGRKTAKGCFSCRKRRIKCDQTRPSCANCVRSNFTCDGYPEVSWHHSHCSTDRNQDGILKLVKAKPSIVFAQYVLAQPDVSYIAYINNLLEMQGQPAWVGLNAGKAMGSLAYDCLLALALTYFGQQQHLPETRARGIMLYMQSLNRVRADLSQDVCSISSDMALVITILYIFEMLMFTSVNGWINHALGLSKLMETQGPSLYASEPHHSILVANRFNIILASLATSKPTILSGSDWKTMPWQSLGLEKDSMQTLLDIFADLPDLRHLIHLSCPLTEVRKMALDILQRLQSWRDRANIHPHHTQTSKDDGYDLTSFPWCGVSLSYENLTSANEICLFNAGLIQTITLLRSAEVSHNKTYVLPSDLLQIMNDAAVEISRSVKYQLTAASPLIGQLFLLYPLRMAWIAFDKNASPQGRWVADMVVSLSRSQQTWAVAAEAINYKLEISE